MIDEYLKSLDIESLYIERIDFFLVRDVKLVDMDLMLVVKELGIDYGNSCEVG